MYSQATVSRANSPWSGLSFRQSWEAGGSMLKATVRKVIGRGWSGALVRPTPRSQEHTAGVPLSCGMVLGELCLP